jgi:hypothetical protein
MLQIGGWRTLLRQIDRAMCEAVWRPDYEKNCAAKTLQKSDKCKSICITLDS